MSRKLRVSIVDDDIVVRATMKLMVEHVRRCEVVSTHPSGEDALSVLPAVQPDIVLLDIRMPGKSGIECARELRGLVPAAAIVMVTACLEDALIADAFHAGAIGYLVKPCTTADIARAIENASKGAIHLEGPVSERFAAWIRGSRTRPLPALTEREVEVLALVKDGLSDKEIGDRLGLTPATVKAHLRNILRKLKAKSRSGAVSLYFNYF